MINFYLNVVIMSLVISLVVLLVLASHKMIGRYMNERGHYWFYVVLFFLYALPLIYIWPSSSPGSAYSVTIFPEQSVSTVLFSALPYLLLAGTAVSFMVYGIRYLKMHQNIMRLCRNVQDERCLRQFHDCKHQLGIKKNIALYQSPAMTTPFIYGLWKPKIVIPNMFFNDKQLRYIFLHELSHYKRNDLWIKPVLMLIQSLHWFNPLIYVFRNRIEDQGEYAIDERLTQSISPEEREGYGRLILEVMWCTLDEKSAYSSAMSQRRKVLEKRMGVILSETSQYPLRSRVAGGLIVFAILVAGAGAGALANERVDISLGLPPAQVEDEMDESSSTEGADHLFGDEGGYIEGDFTHED